MTAMRGLNDVLNGGGTDEHYTIRPGASVERRAA
jgi:hypothetical protein